MKKQPANQQKKASSASQPFVPSVTSDSFYHTMSPFEHYDSVRSQLFPYAETVETIAGSKHVKIVCRSTDAAKNPYPQPYNVITRQQDQLFVFGGEVRGEYGSYVARVNTTTLEEEWRIYIKDEGPGDFNWPGLLAVHGNGQLYAVAGNLMAKINPDTQEYKIIKLPQHEGQGGAVYNGFDVAADGIIFTKSMEAGKPLMNFGSEAVSPLEQLRSVAMNDVPAFILAVNPHNLDILSQVEAPEAGLGRLTCERRDGVDYIYFLGITRLWRYLFKDGRLTLDEQWGPVPYLTGGGEPGTAVGLLGDWAVFATNFLASASPLEVFAVNIWNSNKIHSLVPFGGKKSQEWSKPALDLANSRVYVADQLANMVGGLDFNPQTGFSKAWEAKQQHMASFWAIVGDKDDRQIIGTAYTAAKGEEVIWRDAETGEEIVRSGIVDKGGSPSPSIVTPGFDGRFYYLAQEEQRVTEMTPVAKQNK